MVGVASIATNFAPKFVARFAAGMYIRTTRGEVQTDYLEIGDKLISSSGDEITVSGIICFRFSPDADCGFFPVKIAKDTFKSGQPSQDAILFSNDLICLKLIDEIQVPLYCLIDRIGVADVGNPDVVYFIIEIDSPAIFSCCGLLINSCDKTEEEICSSNKIITYKQALDKQVPVGSVRNIDMPIYKGGSLVMALRHHLQSRASILGLASSDPHVSLYAIVGDRVIWPHWNNNIAKFVIPSIVPSIQMFSAIQVPAEKNKNSDDVRKLGISVSEIIMDDGINPPFNFSLRDVRFRDGFYEPEGNEEIGWWRWTKGTSSLDQSLWEECCGPFFVKVVTKND